MRIVQGADGGQTHSGAQKWSWDFGVDEGTDVFAAAPGRVVEAVDGNEKGGPFSIYAWNANYVTIDHGNNRFSNYFHLRKGGVFVKVGDEVFRGQRIGSSGNTGFSFGPHLHFSVTDEHGTSVPVCFEDAADDRPAEGRDYSGEPIDPAEKPQTTELSRLPVDVFADAGVTLRWSYLSRWLTDRWPVTISGTAEAGQPVVAMTFLRGASEPARRIEARPDAMGRFNLVLRRDDLPSAGYFVVGTPDRFGRFDPGLWIPVVPQP